MPRRSIEEYQAGWVCALSKELTAARAMLDEEHEEFQSRVAQDNNRMISSDAAVHRFLRFSRQHFLKPYAISATEHRALYDSLIGEESTGFLDSVQENPRFLSWMKEMHTYF